jgi:hypothetical protein
MSSAVVFSARYDLGGSPSNSVRSGRPGTPRRSTALAYRLHKQPMGIEHSDRARLRTPAEAAFALLRVLMTGQVLFAGDSGLSLSAAAGLVDAPPAVLRAALARLLGEGVVVFDAVSATFRLSGETLADLCAPHVLH